MQLLPRKGLLAIVAVLDIAVNARTGPVSAKALADRHDLPARHLEPVLQALVRDGILKGIRGPRGGYELGRPRKKISANDILRAAGTLDDDHGREGPVLLDSVVLPAISQAERSFAQSLGKISVEELARRAEPKQRNA